MFSRYLTARRVRRRNRAIIDDLYDGIVARSRRPLVYATFGVPDTVMGRFESLSVHVFLALARCRDDDTIGPVAQDLVDRFIADIEDSIRQIGIGDVAVPKRMRKLAGMFYERVAAYDEPLRAGDMPLLAERLERFALADAAPPDRDAAAFAAYMRATEAELAAVPAAAILSGHLFGEGETR